VYQYGISDLAAGLGTYPQHRDRDVVHFLFLAANDSLDDLPVSTAQRAAGRLFFRPSTNGVTEQSLAGLGGGVELHYL